MNDFPIQHIVKRDGAMVAYDRERIRNAILKATAALGTADHGVADKISGQVEEALIKTYADQCIPSVEDIQDVVESVLMLNGHTDIAKKYIIYRSQRAMARAAKAYQFEVTDNVPYKKIYEVLRWNMEHYCDSVESLNRIISKGKFPCLVKDVEQRYQDEIAIAANAILKKIDKTRIIIIAGPSSSGKTTTTIKTSEILKKHGYNIKTINIDHYFFDLEKHPKDEFGDYDYETPNALDLELINTHLVQLLSGETVRTPHYNFKSGKRILDVHEMKLEKNELLLIDSLHGLYEGMTSKVPAESKFKLYIETLGQFRMSDGSFMRWADNRLLRRMIRDKDHRNLQPMQTLTHWHYVRRSELNNIIPYIKNVDVIVNSALPYELPVMRSLLLPYISKARTKFAQDPKRLDAHIRANRVYCLLKPVKAVKDLSCIPPNSLLREFVGGSCYKY